MTKIDQMQLRYATGDTPRRIVILIYPDICALDTVGPLEAFAMANDLAQQSGTNRPLYDLAVVAATASPVPTSVGFAVTPTCGIDQLEFPVDTLLVSGGDGRLQASKDERLITFLRRAVRMCVRSGITQFLDIGSGIPTVGNVHEIAQLADPTCRVVYVDVDPVAISHTRQILAGNERATVVRGDFRKPDEILAADELRRMLDFDKPIALILVAVLHFIHDSDDPAGIIRRFHDALVPGSHLVIAHGSRDTEGMPTENLHSAREMYQRSVAQVSLRSQQEVADLFAGWSLLPPGVVWIPHWRPDDPILTTDPFLPNAGYAGVGRKPRIDSSRTV